MGIKQSKLVENIPVSPSISREKFSTAFRIGKKKKKKGGRESILCDLGVDYLVFRCASLYDDC